MARGPGILCAGAALMVWLELKWAQARALCVEGTLQRRLKLKGVQMGISQGASCRGDLAGQLNLRHVWAKVGCRPRDPEALYAGVAVTGQLKLRQAWAMRSLGALFWGHPSKTSRVEVVLAWSILGILCICVTLARWLDL